MHNRANVVYCYDGSFEGFLCCVFDAYEKKREPADIFAEYGQPLLFEDIHHIETDIVKAKRVYDALQEKISLEVQEMVWLGFLTCTLHKEMLLYQFIRLAFLHGGKVLDMLTDDTVSALQKAVRHLQRESHLFKGFIRFSVHERALAAVIEPKNYVLPLLSQHFADRYEGENFLIFDKTNSAAIVHRPGETVIIPMQELQLPPINEDEAQYQRLWKQFYKTIGIQSRYNPKCRMTLMPKRYWSNMLEVRDELEGGAKQALKSSKDVLQLNK